MHLYLQTILTSSKSFGIIYNIVLHGLQRGNPCDIQIGIVSIFQHYILWMKLRKWICGRSCSGWFCRYSGFICVFGGVCMIKIQIFEIWVLLDTCMIWVLFDDCTIYYEMVKPNIKSYPSRYEYFLHSMILPFIMKWLKPTLNNIFVEEHTLRKKKHLSLITNEYKLSMRPTST